MFDFLKKDKTPQKNYDWIFAGLGNPGEKYANTRHNIGWMAIEELAKRKGLNFQAGKGNFYYADWKFAGKQIMLCIPTTYMNNTGEALKYIQNKNGIKSNKFVILVDEYNFPVGKIHLKAAGSGGGHNGTASVIQHLEQDNFYRLRMGIDRNFGPGELVEYVLSNFEENEKEGVEEMINKTILSLEHLIKAGAQRAISDINSGKIFKD